MLVILLIIYAFACSQEFYVNFPAVYGGKGDLINIKIKMISEPGLYIKINKLLDIDTQESFITAYKISKNKCGVIVDFNDNLSGGSGGLLFYIVNKYYTNKTIATGGIDNQGNILPIGGLEEKIKASLAIEDSNFITTVENPYQYYIVKKYSSKKNITIANHINDLYYEDGKVYGNGKPNIFKYPKIPNKKSKYNSTIFKDSYLYIKGLILGYNLGIPELDEYYKEYIKYTDEIYNMEYYYTAANLLFLKAAEKIAIYHISKDIDIKSLKDNVKECLNSFKIEGNSELDIGALARYKTAELIISKDKKDYKMHSDGKYRMYYEHAQAMMWCNLAKQIHKNQYVNERNVTDLLIDWIKKGYEHSDNERFAYAISSLDNPYVSLFHLSFIVENNEGLKPSYKSIWANVYASNAEYLESVGEYYDASLANNLEILFSSKENFEFSPVYILLGIAIAFLIIFLLFR